MNQTHPSSRYEDLPLALAALAAGNKTRNGCVIAAKNLFAVGQGELAELDAVATFGTGLTSATVYSTRMPDDVVLKFLEKCGLRRMVILKDPPPAHDSVFRQIAVDYIGPCVYRLRDIVKALEHGPTR